MPSLWQANWDNGRKANLNMNIAMGAQQLCRQALALSTKQASIFSLLLVF